jgi:ABC-type transport system involved in cytochrome c biogenesis ATPase subunit
VLDEPLGAIDADGIQDIESALDEHLSHNGMVVLTTHQSLHLGQGSVCTVQLAN